MLFKSKSYIISIYILNATSQSFYFTNYCQLIRNKT